MKYMPKQFCAGVLRGPRPNSYDDLCILADAGVTTIFSLEEGWSRIFGWRFEAHDWQVRIGGLFYLFPLSNLFPPSAATCIAITDLLIHDSNGPLGESSYVHCYAGVDRTGFILAVFRVRFHKWKPLDAWAEAQEYGMHRRYWWWKKHFLKLCSELPNETDL